MTTQVMMAKSSVRNMFDVMAGDRMATIMGYLSEVPAGRDGHNHGISLGCASR
jgi:hypothetical protein